MLEDRNRVIDQLLTSLQGYEVAREYDGIDVWETIREDSRLSRTLRQAGIQYDPNFCGVVIDSRTDRMKIKSTTGADNRQTAMLAEIMTANKMDLYYPTWQRNSVRDGDGYILVWPDGDSTDSEDDGEPGDAPALGIYTPDQVNITYIDPMRGRIFYNPQNPRVVDFFAQLYSVPVPDEKTVIWHMEIYYPDSLEHYATPPRSAEHEGITGEDFAPYVEGIGRLDITTDLDDIPGDVWPDENPYGMVPVFHLPTDLPYGKPEARNAYGPQDLISKLVEIQAVTVQFMGWPQLYAIQEAQSLAQQTIREDPLAEVYAGDTPDIGDDDRSTVSQGVQNETGSSFEFSPGSLALFKNFKEVGQFVTADPDALLEPLREQMKIVSGTTGTPLHRFVGSGEPPSGESLKVANQPTNDRADRLKDLFGAALKDAYEFALLLCGIPSAVVKIEWRPSEQESEIERWTLVKMRTDAGVPYKDAMMMAGVEEPIAAKWALDREAQQEKERQHAMALAVKAPAPSNDKPPVKPNTAPAPR